MNQLLPVVDTPVVYGIGFVVFVLLALPVTSTWIGSIVTVAHELGHVAIGILSGRGLIGFEVNEDSGGGATDVHDYSWGVTLPLFYLVGYPTPPLLGLSGAALLADGRVLPVLWIAAALLLWAFFQAGGFFTHLVVLLIGAGVVWAALGEDPRWQAATAVALVWTMLLGVIRSLVKLGTGTKGGDAWNLARTTWIPAVLWVAGFWAIGLYCLWHGARLLTVP